MPIRISERTGQELKPVPLRLPARCTRACRHYSPPDPASLDSGGEYTPSQLWHLETEVFGTWLSPDLFEQLDKITPAGRALAREMAARWPLLPAGTHLLPGVVARRSFTHTRTGSVMVWLTLATESSYIDIAVFGPRGEDGPDLITVMRFLQEGALVLATVERSYYKQHGVKRQSNRLAAIRRLG